MAQDLDRVALDAPWAAATDRQFRITDRLPAEYYQHADRWLRNEVEAERVRGNDPTRSRDLLAAARASRAALVEIERAAS